MATHWLKYNSPSKPVPRPSDPSPIGTLAQSRTEEEPKVKLRGLLETQGLGSALEALLGYGVASVEDFTLLVDADVLDIRERHGLSHEQAKAINSLRSKLATPVNLEMARLKVGLRPILQIMNDRLDDGSAQEESCKAILELIPMSTESEWRRVKSEDGMRKQAHLRALLSVPECGTVKAICAAAEAHRQNLDLQMAACRVLHILCRAQENLVRVAHGGGIEAVVSALQVGATEPTLQVLGCSVLARMGLDAECYALIPRKGGVVAVIGSMRLNGGQAAVQEAGCLALHNLTWREGEVDNKRVVVEAGGVEAVIAAMREHAQNTGVQQEAMACLCSLAGTQQGGLKVVLGQRGAIEAVVNAMKGHISEARVQEQAVMALHNLCNSQELSSNVVRMRGAGAVEAVSTAMANHPESDRVQSGACLSGARVGLDDVDAWSKCACAARLPSISGGPCLL